MCISFHEFTFSHDSQASFSQDAALITTATFSVVWSYFALGYTWRRSLNEGGPEYTPVSTMRSASPVSTMRRASFIEEASPSSAASASRIPRPPTEQLEPVLPESSRLFGRIRLLFGGGPTSSSPQRASPACSGSADVESGLSQEHHDDACSTTGTEEEEMDDLDADQERAALTPNRNTSRT